MAHRFLLVAVAVPFAVLLACGSKTAPGSDRTILDAQDMAHHAVADMEYHGGSPDLATPANQCPDGQTDCGGGNCVDTTSDSGNCGGCGIACGIGEECTAGVCGPPGGCPNGETACNGACTDTTTDVGNCGACGNSCVQAQVCTNGMCVDAPPMACPNGQVMCGNACTDVTTDPTNCGACGAACAMGQTCSGGKCAAGGNVKCPQGQRRCSGVCVDKSSDPNNCGACGNACAQGESCQQGQCVGGGGQNGGGTGCAACVDCLNACNAGDQVCEQGCVDNTTMQGQQLLQAALACLGKACPSTNNGVCDQNGPSYSTKKCNSCYSTAQSPGGKCGNQINACLADM